jgi:hypothetical protein
MLCAGFVLSGDLALMAVGVSLKINFAFHLSQFCRGAFLQLH